MLTLLSLTRLSPHVVPIGDEVVVSGALAPVPGAPFTKEICDFLATLDLLNLDRSGKMIGCLLKEKAIRDKSNRGGASSRLVISKEKSDKCRIKKSSGRGKASVDT